MSDPILLFLSVDVVGLLLLGLFAAVVPSAVCGFLITGLSGLGALLCLPPLLLRADPSALNLPIGPPGLSLHLALDPLAAFFLVVVFVAATAIAAFQTATGPLTRAALPQRTPATLSRMLACGLAGAVLTLLAADGVAMSIGLAILCSTRQRQPVAMLIPLTALAAICLLTPPGYPPRFDAIRAAPIDTVRAAAAAGLMVAAAVALAMPRPGPRCWTRDAMAAGVIVPSGLYLLLRVVAELASPAAQSWWGPVLLAVGAAFAIIQGWRSSERPEIDGAVTSLVQRQAGLAITAVGLALIARSADLPGAATAALQATFLTILGISFAGTLTLLAAHIIGASAGTYRLSRLGGLVQLMPRTSGAFACGVLALSALPPGLGFASLWLMLQAILSAPRTGGLPAQLPLALIAAAIALAAALATAASIRLIGVAILGRPRTPRGSGAQESRSPIQAVLLALSLVSLGIGILPGLVLRLLADPAIRILSGFPTNHSAALSFRSLSASAPIYPALPVVALLALGTAAALLIRRWPAKEVKPASVWADGMRPPLGLPFGEAEAQSAGAGFLPKLPPIRLPAAAHLHMPSLAMPRLPRPPSSIAGIWFVLAGFGVLLLVLALSA